MELSAPIIHAFNAGELSPLMDGRTDQDKYHAGCRVLRNFLPLVHGPATRRGGTRYVGNVKTAANRTWLATFRFSLYQNYVLEFGDHYLRFWTNRGQLLNGGPPYEIATPWAFSDLTTPSNTFALRFDQSGDIVWITNVNGTFAPYKLTRLAALNWTLTAVAFADGPFTGVQPTNAITVQASATTGAVTLTASSAIFSASDVGTSFYLESSNPALAPSFQTGHVYGAGSLVSNNGNTYLTAAGGTSGAFPPIVTLGSQSDGGVTWQYLHSGYGIVQITGFTSGTVVSGTVLTGYSTGAQPIQLPRDCTAVGYGGVNNTNRWSLSLFSATRGWPVDVKFFRSRLAFVGSNWVVASSSGLYDTFSIKDGPDVLETCAVVEQLPVETLTWCAPSLALLVGTPSQERSVQEQSTAKVFASDNIKDQVETKYGSAPVEPIALSQAVLFVQRTQQRIRELVYDYLKAKFIGDDLTVMAEHMFVSGICEMEWAQEPDTLLWCVLNDGSLAALTYNRERGVVAWSRHYIGGNGIVEAAAVVPSPDGTKDDLWLIVRRTINGSTVRFVEFMEDRKLYQTGLQNSFYVDAGITYSGAPTSVISGLGYLEGQTVDVLGDGYALAQQLVTGGTINLPQPVSTAQIGFNPTAVLVPMRIDMPTQNGTAQSRSKAVAELYIRFVDTIGGKAGASQAGAYPLGSIDMSQPVGTPPALFSGDMKIGWDHGYPDTDALMYIVQDQPLPMTVVALMPRIEVND